MLGLGFGCSKVLFGGRREISVQRRSTNLGPLFRGPTDSAGNLVQLGALAVL